MKQQAQVLPEQVKRDKNITRLENSLDKAQVKYETASSISSCYENILDKLREVSFLYNRGPLLPQIVKKNRIINTQKPQKMG